MHEQKLVIFGSPRTGTKLLADIYQQQGYHNFGEFLNTFSGVINTDSAVPYTTRMPITDQRQLRETRSFRGRIIDDCYHRKEVKNRLNLLQDFKHISPSIITVWLAAFDYAPVMLDDFLRDRFFLCTQRQNVFEQLLSRLVTLYHLNHNNEIPSDPITIDLDKLTYQFITHTRVRQLQQYLVDCGRGKFIDFDELISGTADLGFRYEISTIDQHKNIHDLILNLDEALLHFNRLTSVKL